MMPLWTTATRARRVTPPFGTPGPADTCGCALAVVGAPCVAQRVWAIPRKDDSDSTWWFSSATRATLRSRFSSPSASTCLRRVRRLVEEGVIERQIAIVSAAALAAGLTAIVEVTLERQSAELLAQFEQQLNPESAVQQCYRVSAGPDFVLVVYVADM